jgi:hypothetical protein
VRIPSHLYEQKLIDSVQLTHKTKEEALEDRGSIRFEAQHRGTAEQGEPRD